MADRKTEALVLPAPEKASPKEAPADVPPVMSSDHTLGKIMAAARERRGLTQSQSSAEANIPAYYLEMIESDDYSAIADQLYLLPFLRRYAIFIRLDPEEVASRFIRDVQRADMNATRMSDPIAMIERRRKSRSLPIAVIAVVAIAVLALVWLVYRLFFSGPSPEAPAPSAVASPTVQLAPQVPARPATVPPQVAVPQARPRPQTFPRNESLPSGSAAQGNLAPRTGVGSGAPVRPGYPPPAHPPLPPPEPDTE